MSVFVGLCMCVYICYTYVCLCVLCRNCVYKLSPSLLFYPQAMELDAADEVEREGRKSVNFRVEVEIISIPRMGRGRPVPVGKTGKKARKRKKNKEEEGVDEGGTGRRKSRPNTDNKEEGGAQRDPPQFLSPTNASARARMLANKAVAHPPQS